MASPAYAHQDPPVKLRLHRPLLELKPLQEKYWEAQHLVKQMAVHEVGLCIQAILDKPLPMHWMHDLSIQMLGELLRLHPAIVTSEFGKVGMAQFIRKVTVLWVGFWAMARWKWTSHGSFQNMDMSTLQLCFSRNLLWTKETLRNYEPDHQEWSLQMFEASDEMYNKQNDLCKEPACTARAWLVPIWKDVPCTRPNQELLVSCITTYNNSPYAVLVFRKGLRASAPYKPRIFWFVWCTGLQALMKHKDSVSNRFHTCTGSQSQRFGLLNYHRVSFHFSQFLVRFQLCRTLARLKFRTPEKTARWCRRWMYVKSQKTPN